MKKTTKAKRPSRSDPTRTTSIQRRFYADIVSRFRSLKQAIVRTLVAEDDFGLGTSSTVLRLNARFVFETDSNRVQRFSAWLTQQINDGVLESSSGKQPFTVTYITSTYKRAAIQAFLQSRPELQATSTFFKGSQAEFLREAFDSPIPQDRIQLLATRSFENLKGITSKMSTDLNRIFADGVSRQESPRAIARQITKEIDEISKKRALRLARTEIVHAYAEGSLDSYDRLGVESLGVDVEWSTAGDDRVCPKCADQNAKVYTTVAARGLIPFHPNCRCAWIPSFRKPDDKTTKGQTPTQETLPLAEDNEPPQTTISGLSWTGDVDIKAVVGRVMGGDDHTPADADAEFVKLIGTSDHSTIAKLVGAPDGSRVRYEKMRDGQVTVEVMNRKLNMNSQRTIYRDTDGSLVMGQDYLEIRKAPKGTGTDVLKHQIDQASALGVSKLKTYAERDVDFNGYYTWARLGYDADLIPDDELKAKFPGVRTVSGLMKTPEGRAWWLANGQAFAGEFDLSDNSESMQVFRSYYSAKIKEKRTTTN